MTPYSAEAVSAPTTPGEPTTPQTVIVASADASVRADAAVWLGSAGFAVTAAATAERALELVASERPSVFIADESMRHGDRALIEAVAELPLGSRPAVLALCAGRGHAAAALVSGADDVVERPFDWRVASHRAGALARLGKVTAEAARVRDEVVHVRRVLDEERRTRQWLDHFDALTGLPDDQRFEHALDRALVSASERSQVAVALFDVEHLVLLNSRLGRARANSVLQQLAQRLIAGLRCDEVLKTMAPPSFSMAARLGAGVFGVVLTGLPGERETRIAVRTLLQRLCGRYQAGDEDIVLSTSAGVALAPQDATTAEALLQKAELAVAEAVERGGSIRFHRQVGRRVTERSRVLLRLLPSALAQGDLQVHYQPVLDGGSMSEVTAAEALLRWHLPELGQVSPSEFVPLAEETGLMVSIGNWVLRTVCRQIRTWLDQGLPPVRVSVNVSLCQLMRGELAELVREAVTEAGIPPELLELELSERGVLRGDPEVLSELQAIRALGVRLAIDDFGIGNCGIGYLKQFPIDVLKIDESLIRGVDVSAEDAAITGATIAMAHKLGLRVVAEGVERSAQMEFLRQHGCGACQGFLFSPAVPPDQFLEYLRAGLRPRREGGHRLFEP